LLAFGFSVSFLTGLPRPCYSGVSAGEESRWIVESFQTLFISGRETKLQRFIVGILHGASSFRL
jgi:hypothetical protein